MKIGQLSSWNHTPQSIIMISIQTTSRSFIKLFSQRRAQNISRQRKSYSNASSSSSTINFKSLFAWYSHKLDTHPLTTKCLTSGFIHGSGDICCQTFFEKDSENKSKKWDMYRTARMSFLGFALIAPVMHNWYGTLMKSIPGRNIKATLQRLALDQFMFAPLLLPTWIWSNMTLQGCNTNAIQSKLKLDYWDMLKANWGLWVPTQAINLGIVPNRYQVLFGNMVGLVWSVYLSYKGGNTKS